MSISATMQVQCIVSWYMVSYDYHMSRVDISRRHNRLAFSKAFLNETIQSQVWFYGMLKQINMLREIKRSTIKFLNWLHKIYIYDLFWICKTLGLLERTLKFMYM